MIRHGVTLGGWRDVKKIHISELAFIEMKLQQTHRKLFNLSLSLLLSLFVILFLSSLSLSLSPFLLSLPLLF